MDEVLSGYLWVEQMKEAMRIISNACYANRNYSDCKKCPFDAYCDAISTRYDIPEAWDTVHFEVN